MTLLDIRTKFVEASGRYDLVVDVDNYVDNGANFFIQAGQRYLDCILPNPNSEKVFRKDIAAGDYDLFIKHLRYVEMVEIYNADGRKGELAMWTLARLRSQYTDLVSAATQSKPAYFAL